MTSQQTTERAEGIPPITVVGVGGGGCNAVDRMIGDRIRGVEFVAVNTDNQQLKDTKAETVLRIADGHSNGLGVGGDPTRGARAAENSREALRELFEDVDMVFITAGMGGGTGTGAAPIVAETAKEAGALTIAVVTRPFNFEGAPRMKAADEGIRRLNEAADTVIVIPNMRLLELKDRALAEDAFDTADDVLRQAVQGISDVITVPGKINLDFNDIKRVMGDGGHAVMALGRGSGDVRAEDAVEEAMLSPLLEDSIHGATRVLYNITTNGDLAIKEIQSIAETVQAQLHPEAEIFMGTAVDDELDGELHITLIATGFHAAVPHSTPVASIPAQQSAPLRAQPASSANSANLATAEAAVDPLADYRFEPAPLPSDDQISTPAFIRQQSQQSAFNLEPSAGTNGHTNGHSNGHANGRSNGGGRWDPDAVRGE